MCTDKTTHLCAIGLVVWCLGASAESAVAQEWEWVVAPYVWASDTSVDVFVNNEPVFGADLSFSDLIDKIDMALQLHVEGRRDKFGFFLDLTYLDLGETTTTPANPPLPGDTVIDTDIELTMIEAGGTYWPSGELSGLSLLLGVRVIDLGVDVIITPPSPSPLSGTRVQSSVTLTDGFAGLRYVAPLGQRWILTLRGDAGAGDSDLTWNASAILGYQFGKNNRYNMLLGYRHLVIEFEDNIDGVRVEVEQTMSGPEVGFAFRF